MNHITGDILKVEHGVICHQVNCKGVMGAGIAKRIRSKWPLMYSEYRQYCLERNRLGRCLLWATPQHELYIANLFGQDRYGRDRRYTDYERLKAALEELKETISSLSIDHLPVYIPVGMGCNNAGGNWEVVESIIESILPNAIGAKYRL